LGGKIKLKSFTGIGRKILFGARKSSKKLQAKLSEN
jgi:hypothetical protein